MAQLLFYPIQKKSLFNAFIIKIVNLKKKVKLKRILFHIERGPNYQKE